MAATDKYSGTDMMILFGSSDTIESINDPGADIDIELTAHTFSALNPIYITGVVGMTDLNDYWIISAKDDANHITVPCVTSQSYTSGGTVWNAVFATGWTLDVVSDSQDVTDNTSSGWIERIPTEIKSVSGTLEGFFIDGATRPTRGTAITFYLHMDGTDNYSVSAIITGESGSVSVGGDAAKWSYTFEGTSTLTETNA